jgi:hypothetical protein
MNRASSTVSIAIVGAGIAGLVAARHLRHVGHDIHVFDKARGPGGRMSTRYEHGYEFDHGAQYFTVRDGSFRKAVDRWRERGLVAVWPGRIVNVENGGAPIDCEPIERCVAVPRMNALCRDLSDSLTVTFNTPVFSIARANAAWAVPVSKVVSAQSRLCRPASDGSMDRKPGLRFELLRGPSRLPHCSRGLADPELEAGGAQAARRYLWWRPPAWGSATIRPWLGSSISRGRGANEAIEAFEKGPLIGVLAVDS